LRFAIEHAKDLGYLAEFAEVLQTLTQKRVVTFQDGEREVSWEYREGDFPDYLARVTGGKEKNAGASPHAILFDAFSPAKNPAMWTAEVFANLFKLLDPARPCALPTYSRSTMLRVSLLLAGFWVGAGHATGEKEETTIAANARELIAEPLDAKWLKRARNSTSAEPMWEPVYRQARLSPDTWEKLQGCEQFRIPAGS
jgi:tRNA U34 5-methylaminomethyl-2-thiouridine-forming methyltransferase MnmC